MFEASSGSLWGSHNVTCAFVRVAQALHQWSRRGGRWSQVWTAFHNKNCWQHREKVNELVRSDRRLTVRMMAEELNINRESVRIILSEELGMRKMCAKMVPKLLSDDHKQHRVRVCEDTLEEIGADPDFLRHIITGDETWVFQYDPETKRQSQQWFTPNSPRPKKARMSKSKIKTMLITFFDQKGLVHHEFVPQGQTVNQHFYQEVLKRLNDRVRRCRPALWKNKSWMLHHDNYFIHIVSFLYCHTSYIHAIYIYPFVSFKKYDVWGYYITLWALLWHSAIVNIGTAESDIETPTTGKCMTNEFLAFHEAFHSMIFDSEMLYQLKNVWNINLHP